VEKPQVICWVLDGDTHPLLDNATSASLVQATIQALGAKEKVFDVREWHGCNRNR
jgi:hypothetical protein